MIRLLVAASIVVGCRGSAPAPATPAAPPAARPDAAPATDPTPEVQALTGHWKSDDGGYLEVFGSRGLAGPVTVVTPDRELLPGTAVVDPDFDTTYRVTAAGFVPEPNAGLPMLSFPIQAMVLAPAVPDARIQPLTPEDRAAIAVIVAAYYEAAEPTEVAEVAAVDLDGDGDADAAIVHACRYADDQGCVEDGDSIVVRPAGAGWTFPD